MALSSLSPRHVEHLDPILPDESGADAPRAEALAEKYVLQLQGASIANPFPRRPSVAGRYHSSMQSMKKKPCTISPALPRSIGRAVVAGMLLLATFACQAQARDTITWGLVNFAPGNQSRTDLARELLQEKLTGYRHESVLATIPRITSEIRNGNPWCWIGALKNAERESFSLLSIPFIFTLPQHIIVRRERRAEFTGAATLSLEALLQNGSLRTSIARSRVYNPAIDALLLRYPPLQSHSSIPEAIQMLLADRLDYIVEDIGVAAAHARQLGQSDGLVALPFKEMSPYILGRVMCPKNEWGQKAIAQIDAVLRAERPTPRYRTIVEAFHGEDTIWMLRRLYDDVFLKAE